MRCVSLLLALAVAGCGGADGDAARPARTTTTPETAPANATEREELAVSAACSELKLALRETRPLPTATGPRVRALRREIAAVRRYRRALEAIAPDVAPSWHVGGQAKRARMVERTHRRHIAAARKGTEATVAGGRYPLYLEDPRAIVDDDEQKFGADCG